MTKNIFSPDKKIFTDVYTILRPLKEDFGIARPAINILKSEKKIEQKQIKEEMPDKQKKILKGTFEFAKQFAFSAAIFAIFFLLMNWQAYSKIFEFKFNKIKGSTYANVMQEFAEPKKTVVKQTLLPVSKNPAVEKKNIPSMNIKVAPPDTRLIIPKISKNIPIVQVSDEKLIKRNFDSLEEEIQKALENGVINYPGTSKPGEQGNIVITGHSSYFPWKPGRFKDVFAVLEEVKEGDKLVVYNKQKKYIYTVYKTEVISPRNIEPLKQTKENILTLITCVPVGTDLRRLIIQAKLDSVES